MTRLHPLYIKKVFEILLNILSIRRKSREKDLTSFKAETKQHNIDKQLISNIDNYQYFQMHMTKPV